MCVYMYICTYLYIYIDMNTCTYAYRCTHMKNSFLKRDKRQSKNRSCNVNSNFGDNVLEKN